MSKIKMVLAALLVFAFATNVGAVTQGGFYTVEEARSMLPELPEGTYYQLEYAFSKAYECHELSNFSFVADSLMASRCLQQRVENMEDIIHDVTDQIRKEELVPGDIGIQSINANGNDPMHMGIYIATREDGQQIWMHCVIVDGIPQVVIEAYKGFQMYYHPYCGDGGYHSFAN